MLWLMDKSQISKLRRNLGLTQGEFGQLFDCHSMTVSKWERGVLMPTAYQIALMQQFQATANTKADVSTEQVKRLLVGAGVVAALVWLLTAKG
jgi:putative transcriptional regulator